MRGVIRMSEYSKVASTPGKESIRYSCCTSHNEHPIMDFVSGTDSLGSVLLLTEGWLFSAGVAVVPLIWKPPELQV